MFISFDTSVVRTCFGFAITLYDFFGCIITEPLAFEVSIVLLAVMVFGFVVGVTVPCLIVQPPVSRMSVGSARPVKDGGRRRGVGVGALEEDGVVVVTGDGDDNFDLLVLLPGLPRRDFRRMDAVVVVVVGVDLALVGVFRFSRLVEVVFF